MKGYIMKLKTVRNKLLEFKKEPLDGQDYETAAHLIVIMNNCPKISYEMFGVTEFKTYGDEDQGVWSEFAEEGLVQ